MYEETEAQRGKQGPEATLQSEPGRAEILSQAEALGPHSDPASKSSPISSWPVPSQVMGTQ